MDVFTAILLAQTCFMEIGGQRVELDICNQAPVSQPTRVKSSPSVGETTNSPSPSSEPSRTLPSFNNQVTRAQWEEILSRNITKLGEAPKKPVTLDEVKSILGFSGEVVYQRGNQQKIRWIDSQDTTKKIEIIFINEVYYQGAASV